MKTILIKMSNKTAPKVGSKAARLVKDYLAEREYFAAYPADRVIDANASFTNVVSTAGEQVKYIDNAIDCLLAGEPLECWEY